MATEEHSEGLAFHPMDQFIVNRRSAGTRSGFWTVTNVTLWMAIAVLGSSRCSFWVPAAAR
ncbi:MAG: hypothetical protein M9957_10170 [Rhodobacteraceae bacterium]|nr:hypothetical protein [Paracoccaceae bacterium]